jgi:hypothetical protein
VPKPRDNLRIRSELDGLAEDVGVDEISQSVSVDPESMGTK